MNVDADEIPARELQGELVRGAAPSRELQENSKWYLVSQSWWTEWKAFVGYEDSPRGAEASEGKSSLMAPGVSPGPIDNEGLLLEGNSSELVPRLVEGLDYTLVPREAWELLHQWYSGGPEICRGVMRAGGMVGGVLQVEVYPLVLAVEKRRLGEEKSHEFLVSKKETVKNLLHSICAKLWLPPTSTRLYLQTDRYEFTHLDDLKRSVDSYYIMSGQRLLVDAARFDGSYLGPPQRPISALDAAAEDEENTSTTRGESNPYFRQMSGKYVSSTRGLGMAAMWKDSTEPAIEKGVTGLINLGNTCFMNSSIQCLSNVPGFCQLFRRDDAQFSALLNRDNAMGTGGKLAEDCSELLKKMWSGDYSYVAPKNLKYTLGNFAPQFSGYRQQDAQELLAFLLDGLHEDFNEVAMKPYFSDQLIFSGSDVDGPEAAAVGAESWSRHLARNKSEIVELFDGLLRSRLQCPSCETLSVTFDPFRYLSVPIPDADKCSFDVTFVPSSHLARPKRYRVETSIHSNVKDLHRELARLTGVPFGSILFANESRGSIRSFLRSDAKGIGAFESFDHILAFEALTAPGDYEEGTPADAMEVDSNGEAEDGEMRPGNLSLEARISDEHHLLQFLFRKIVEPGEEGHSGSSDAEIEIVSIPLVRCVKKTVSHTELMETVEEYLSLYGSVSTRERSEATARRSPKSGSEVKFPFSLRTVSGNGRRCALCGPSSSCLGCPFEDVRGEDMKSGQTIAVDLHFIVGFCAPEVDSGALDASGNEEESTPDLEQCLELFTREEVLQGGQEWFCPYCKKHVGAAKKLEVWRWPKVLVIHLKRFYHLQGSNKRVRSTEQLVSGRD